MEILLSGIAAFLLAVVAVYLASANRQKLTEEAKAVTAEGTSKIVSAATQLVERVEASTSFTLAAYEERIRRAETEMLETLKDRASMHERLALLEVHVDECERDRAALTKEVMALQKALGGKRHNDLAQEEDDVYRETT